MRLSANAISNYWHAIRYLKPRQIVGRVRFHLSAPRVDASTAPPPRRALSGHWEKGIGRRASMVAPNAFRFLNVTREIGDDWDDPDVQKLWRYNLHYFDDLNALGAVARAAWHRDALARWVRRNPPPKGSGWEPYPTSLRIVNWIKWALAGNALDPECARSIGVQARWLSKRLETHLLGNHLLANAKALLFAGFFHDGPEAAAWLDTGFAILAEQVSEQVLEDGGHFELSPMYHAIALEDILDLCNLCEAFTGALPARWAWMHVELRGMVPRMGEWLRAMTHPDGGIAFFNDGALGVAPTLADLVAYAGRLRIPFGVQRRAGLTHLKASGYARLEAGPASVILDVARVGPDYLPAHAHADTLSFECSLGSHRVIVNSGVSEYGTSPERLRQRGTAAHSTVVVDGLNSSEVWGGFRMARRARPESLVLVADYSIRVRCSHDGYRRLSGTPVHTREWVLDAHQLTVADTVTGGFRTAQARFHLHPAVQIGELQMTADGGSLGLQGPDGTAMSFTASGGTVSVDHATWHPEFGVSVPNRCITVAFTSTRIRSTLRWAPES